MIVRLHELIHECGGNVTLQKVKAVLLGRLGRGDGYDIVKITINPPEPCLRGQQVIIARWFVKSNPEGDIICVLQASLLSGTWDTNILDITDYQAEEALFFQEDRKVSKKDFAWTVLQEIKSGDVLQALYIHRPKHQNGKYFQ